MNLTILSTKFIEYLFSVKHCIKHYINYLTWSSQQSFEEGGIIIIIIIIIRKLTVKMVN